MSTTATSRDRAQPDHLQGSILGAILKMGVPSMIGFSTGTLYDLADAYWLSKLGPSAVAAVTILMPFLWVVSSANMIVGAGSVAIISRRYGEGDRRETELAIRETLLLKWAAAILFGAAGFLLLPQIVRLLGAEGETLGQSVVYGRIFLAGLGFHFAIYSVFTALRGIANPRMAMVLMLAFTTLNIVLDPLLIFGWWIFPALGVAGAAWATVIAYALGFVAGIVLLASGAANVKLRLRSREPIQWGVMRRIIKIGVPSAVGQISFSSSRLVIMPMIALFGMEVVAAYGITTRVTSFGIMLLIGIGLGLSALVGNTLGAGQRARAQQIATQAIRLAVAAMTVLGALAIVAARPIMGLFFDDPALVDHGVTVLRIFGVAFPFLGLFMTIENIFGGVGENRPAMCFNIFHAWLLEVPIVYLLTQRFGGGPEAVWWTLTVSMALTASLFYLYYRRGRWLAVEV